MEKRQLEVELPRHERPNRLEGPRQMKKTCSSVSKHARNLLVVKEWAGLLSN